MLEARSALVEAIGQGGRDGARGGRALRIIEHRGLALAQLTLFASRLEAGVAAAARIVGDALPPSPSNVALVGGLRAYRTGPEQYFFAAADGGIIARLEAGMPPDLGAVTPLSSSRVLVSVEGPFVRQVLAKGLPVDLHPDVFAVGQFVQTGLHHIGVLVERRTDECYYLYFPRTFAVTLFEWLTDACLEYGYDVSSEGP